jgi:hypothetical protein
MLSSKEELAGGYRLANMKRTKKYLYIVEVLILIAAPIFVVLAENRYSLKPFYLPINSFINFILIMLLIIMIESFVFKVLEMRLIKSNSTRYYIAKVAVRRATIILIVSVIIVVLLWTPYINQAIESGFTTKGSINKGQSVAFNSRDAFGLTTVSQISVHANGGSANVYVVSEQNYDRFSGNSQELRPYRINTNDYIANPDLTIELTNMPNGVFYIVVDIGSVTTASSVDYTIASAFSSTFLSYVPLMALLFAVASAGWIAYLIPLQKKYSSGAIYK